MSTFIVAMVVLAIWVVAGIVSVLDPQPMRRPREWSIGSMLDRRN